MIFFTALVDQIMILLDNSLYSWLWFCLTQNLSWLEVGLSWSSGVGIQNWQKQSMQHFFKNWFWIYFFFKLTTFGPSFEFFWFLWGCFLVFWDYFEVGFKFKNIFGTYYCWLSILFWNCNSLFLFIIRPNLKPIFLFLMLPQLGPLLPFLSPSGPFFYRLGLF